MSVIFSGITSKSELVNSNNHSVIVAIGHQDLAQKLVDTVSQLDY